MLITVLVHQMFTDMNTPDFTHTYDEYGFLVCRVHRASNQAFDAWLKLALATYGVVGNLPIHLRVLYLFDSSFTHLSSYGMARIAESPRNADPTRLSVALVAQNKAFGLALTGTCTLLGFLGFVHIRSFSQAELALVWLHSRTFTLEQQGYPPYMGTALSHPLQ